MHSNKYGRTFAKLLKIFIFFMSTMTNCGTIPEAPALAKAVPSVYLRKLTPTTTYESTIPLFFKIEVKVPDNAREESSCDTNRNKSAPCEIASLMRFMMHQTRDDMLTYQAIQMDLSKGRPPRQIGIALALLAGFSMRPIVSKLTNGLFGTGREVESYINEVRNFVGRTDKSVVGMQHDLHEFSNVVHKRFDQLSDDFARFNRDTDKALTSLLQLIVAKIDIDRLHSTLVSCQNRFIPSQILPPSVLARKLTDLGSEIRKSKYELAIPVNRLSEYLKLPLADCMFSENYAWVMINVPIRSVGDEWNLFEIIHTKFAFQGQTCEIYPKDVSYLAVSRSKTVIVDSHILRHCSVAELGICLIPPHSQDSSQSLECAVGMLGGKSVTELRKACAFRCHTNSEIVIKQIDHNKVVITNARSIIFVCANKDESRSFKFDLIGAIEVTLKCNCVVYADKEVIKPPFPCVETETDFGRTHEVYQVIPDLWTTLHTAVGMYGQHVHADHKQIMYDDWNKHVPVFNFSVPVLNYTDSNFGLPGPLETHHGYLVFVLIGVIAVLIGILACVLCICWKKKA